MDKTKISLTLTSVALLGLSIYSVFHNHSETFQPCFFCAKGGVLAFAAGFVTTATVFYYWRN